MRRHRLMQPQPSFCRRSAPLIGGHYPPITTVYLTSPAGQVCGFLPKNNIPAIFHHYLPFDVYTLSYSSTFTHHGGQCPSWNPGQEAQAILDVAPPGRLLETSYGHWDVLAQIGPTATSSPHCECSSTWRLLSTTVANSSSSHGKSPPLSRNPTVT
jgi:hypothetical protein